MLVSKQWLTSHAGTDSCKDRSQDRHHTTKLHPLCMLKMLSPCKITPGLTKQQKKGKNWFPQFRSSSLDVPQTKTGYSFITMCKFRSIGKMNLHFAISPFVVHDPFVSSLSQFLVYFFPFPWLALSLSALLPSEPYNNKLPVLKIKNKTFQSKQTEKGQTNRKLQLVVTS